MKHLSADSSLVFDRMVMNQSLPDPARFLPAWWCRSGHAQTIWASTLRPVPEIATMRRERWDTDDGDFLDLDCVSAEAGRPTLVVLHGLEGSSSAQQVRSVLCAAQHRGWRAFALNFRSCSGEINRLRRSYHAGETSDLRWVIRRIASEHPESPIGCVGMSLGGNVLLKYLGEPGEEPLIALRAAAAISAPFDLAASALAFERGILTRIYMRRLVRTLKQKTEAKLKQFPDLVDRRRLAMVRTIREFDAAVTAPTHGFADAEAYWAACSCRQFLDGIRRPTLLINALDDPLVPPETLPRAEVAHNPRLAGVFPNAGGHVGFISGDRPSHPVLWAEEAGLRFFDQHFSRAALLS